MTKLSKRMLKTLTMCSVKTVVYTSTDRVFLSLVSIGIIQIPFKERTNMQHQQCECSVVLIVHTILISKMLKNEVILAHNVTEIQNTARTAHTANCLEG
jgi:hypothetical protein